MGRLAFALVLSLLTPLATSAQYAITTAGGTGTRGFSGDRGPAILAKFALVSGIAVDGTGNVFVADTENQRVRRIDRFGIVTTVAGRGTPGFCGDGGPAIGACLNNPTGLAIDVNGDLFIADTLNHRVRKVDASGIITTFAGNGIEGYCGDTGPATTICLNRLAGLALDRAGNLYIADNTRIRKVDPARMMHTIAGGPEHGFCGDGEPAIHACLSTPEGIAVDAIGNVYFADYNNWRIRKIDTTGIITTVAGQGVAGFCGDGGPAANACLAPVGVGVDDDGNIVIADSFNDRVRRVDSAGNITTIAGTTPISDACARTGNNGPARSACVRGPVAVAVSADGTIFIAEAGGYRARRLDVGAALSLTKPAFAGQCEQVKFNVLLAGPAPAAGVALRLTSSSDRVVVPPGRVFILRQVISALTLNTTAVSDPMKVTLTATFDEALPWIPAGLVRSSALTLNPIPAELVILAPNPVVGGQPSAGLVRLLCPAAEPVVVELRSAPPVFLTTSSVTVAAGQQYARFEIVTSPVVRQTFPDVVASAGGVSRAQRLVINPATPLPAAPWVKTIAGGGPTLPVFPFPQYLRGDGSPATTAALNPRGVDIDQHGNVFIADRLTFRVRKVGADGTITTIAGNGTRNFCGDGGPATSACLFDPTDVAVDAAGNLYLADGGRIRRVSPDGTITTLATTPLHSSFTSIAVNAAGQIFVAASEDNRVMRYTPGQQGLTTVAGTGSREFCGDGGPAVSACLAFPTGVALDAAGNLFIADQANWRIRKVDVAGTITTVAGSGVIFPFCPSSGEGGPATAACVAYPTAIAVDAAGRLFLSQSAGIQMVDATGTITRLTGFGSGFCGDGVPLIDACFSEIVDLKLDRLGNLLVADGNARIRTILFKNLPPQ